VELFGESLRARRLGQEPPEGGYPGAEIAEVAAELPLADDAPLEDWARVGPARAMSVLAGVRQVEPAALEEQPGARGDAPGRERSTDRAFDLGRSLADLTVKPFEIVPVGATIVVSWH
jgi:hypothetical protein